MELNRGIAPRSRASGKLRVYFMGLFHLEYEPNLRAFARALLALQRGNMSSPCQCVAAVAARNSARSDFHPRTSVREESAIENDLQQADLLYLPLPFDNAHASFVRFSLSTKLVTYLGSGIPIFYHGPTQSAVGELLAEKMAALTCHSLDPAQVATHASSFHR